MATNTNTSCDCMNELFFKDCFTETMEGIDLEVNHLTVGCISSAENAFDLDSEGNLTVKTITATNQILSGGGSSGTFVGDTSIWFGDPLKIPNTHMLCEGQSLNISEYSILFDKIGNTYGGNGTTTFALPDLKGKVVVHKDGTTEFQALGQIGGHRLLQSHNHTQNAHNHAQNTVGSDNNQNPWIRIATGSEGGVQTVQQVAYYASGRTRVGTDNKTATNNATGGGDAENLQPYIVGYYIMKVTGDPYTEDLNNLDSKIQEIESRLNSLSGGSSGIDLNTVYPVGSIYMSVNNTNPSTLFGGTWSTWGNGRVPVGMGSNGTTNYTTVEESGGSDNIALTTANLASHTHTFNGDALPTHNHTQNQHRHTTSTRTSTYGAGMQAAWKCITAPSSPNGDWSETSYTDYQTPTNNAISAGTPTGTNSNTGSGTAHENRMAYITCYMWKRIS